MAARVDPSLTRMGTAATFSTPPSAGPPRLRDLPIEPIAPQDPSITDAPDATENPLISPADWPGVDVSYRFRASAAEAGAPKQPALTLHLAFDPGQVVRGADDGVQAALARYARIAAQLADPDVALALDTTVLPGEAARVASTDALRPALAAFVEAAVAELRTGAGGGTPGGVVSDLAFAVNAAAVAGRGDDLFAVGVRLTLSRNSAQEPTPTRVDVPPDAGSTADEEGGSGGEGVAAWARDFEEAFAGFDGADGQLRVLSYPGSPAPDTSPWALRWSRAAGVWVEFPRDEAAYFTLAPLSTRLMSGSAQITEYDPATLKPVAESPVAFSSVDLDEWGQAFLAALDGLLSPETGAAIARLDEAAHAELTRRRAQMARALSRRLAPVYADASTGSVDAARDAFEQALEPLSSAYAISAVVQLPAFIQMAGDGEKGAARFFGPVAARGERQDGYTASAGTLPLQPTTEAAPGWLTFMVSAAEPRRASTLPLAVAYEVRGVEHLSADGASRRLHFVLPRGMDLALQPLHVPVPLRGSPAPPMPTRQTAAGASERSSPHADPIRDALEWEYTAEVASPGYGAQDELWAEVSYNLPVDPVTTGAASIGTDGAVTGLFQALAAFHAAWTEIAPLIPAAVSPGEGETQRDGPTAQAVVAAATALVASVTDRWAGLVESGDELPLFAAETPPAAETDTFVISFGRGARGPLEVFARPGSGSTFDPARADRWPSINGERPGAAPVAVPEGQGPDAAGGWYRCGYTRGGVDALTLRWSALDLLERQTARSTFRGVRNASLSAGAPLRTNDALVYRTAPVSFATPALPLIEVGQVGSLPSRATLAEVLAQVLQPVSRVGTAAVKERVLQVGVSYEYPLATDDAELIVTDPVLQAGNIPLDSGADSIAAVTAALARELTTWHGFSGRADTGAILCLRVLLFAVADGTRLPLVHFERVEIAVPPGWWTG